MEQDLFVLKIRLKDKPREVRAKFILQDLCRRKLDWDDDIPADALAKWNDWLKELPLLDEFKMDRCYDTAKLRNIVDVQLHHFSDASESGYGAVTYIRLADDEENVCCSLVTGKSRLAPIKNVTIPRLELAAATVAARLDVMVRKELTVPVDCSVFWTDSTTVLQYINSQHRRFNTFVANRLSVIQEASSPSQWRHIDGKLNPADDASRGVSAHGVLKGSRWIDGPEFLYQKEESWPVSKQVIPPLQEDDSEVKTFASVQCDPALSLDDVILRFSSWLKLRKFVAWMLRYRKHLREAVQRRKENRSESASVSLHPITVEELVMAETHILRYVQQGAYADEIHDLSSIKVVKKASSLSKQDPTMVHGLLRVGGRLKNAPIQEDARCPIIVPKNHHIAELIVRDCHEKTGHSGLEYTLSMIREKYWIIGARAKVKQLARACKLQAQTSPQR